MNKNKDINIIVATSTNYGLGYDNKMCWNMPDELKKFKEITSTVDDNSKKNCVIMGKNTWYSLPKRPLINRINIIISSNDYNKIKEELGDNNSNTKVFKNIEDVFKYVENEDLIESAFIIGFTALGFIICDLGATCLFVPVIFAFTGAVVITGLFNFFNVTAF